MCGFHVVDSITSKLSIKPKNIIDPIFGPGFLPIATSITSSAVKDLLTDKLEKSIENNLQKTLVKESEKLPIRIDPHFTVITPLNIVLKSNEIELDLIFCIPASHVDCPTSFTTQQNSGFRSLEQMNKLRDYRDYFLKGMEGGYLLLGLFETHKTELREILSQRPKLLAEVDHAIEAIFDDLGTGDLSKSQLSNNTVDIIQGIIHGISNKASSILKSNLKLTEKMLPYFADMLPQEALKKSIKNLFE